MEAEPAWEPSAEGKQMPPGHCSPCPPLKKAHSLPLTEQSSDKSSQDRLSQLDAKDGDKDDGADCGVTTTAPKRPVRTSARRLSTKLPRSTESKKLSVASNIRPLQPEAHAAGIATTESVGQTPPLPTTVDGGLADLKGLSSEAKAQSARKMGESAAVTAKAKAQHAAKLIAVSQKLATEASRASKRRRVMPVQHHNAHPGNNPVIGVRVSVYWSGDKTFYKGQIEEARNDASLFRVLYDDDAAEWLSLADEQFKLLTPRGKTAGCSSALKGELEALGCQGLAPLEEAEAVDGSSPATGPSPSKEAAVGRRLSLRCPADGVLYKAQVLAFDCAAGTHHLLYADGEDEWVCLADECIQWLDHGSRAFHVGPAPGFEAPHGSAAIGWRIAVYWKSNQAFYTGTVQAFDAAMSRHHVLYNSSDEEYLLLAVEHIKWLQSPPPPAARTAKVKRATSSCSLPTAALTDGWHGRASSQPNLHRQVGKCPTPKRSRSIESVSEMLERVEAEDAALQSDSAPHLAAGAGPALRSRSPSLAHSRESAGSIACNAAEEQPMNPSTPLISPWHTEIGSETPSPHQMSSDRLPLWRPQGPESATAHPYLKPASLEGPAMALVDGRGEELLRDYQRDAGSLPAAPSPMPLLDNILPTSFTREASLLLPDSDTADLPARLADALPSPDEEPGDDLLDALIELPAADMTSSAWWQSL